MPRTAITPIALTRNGAATLTYTAVASADDAMVSVREAERCVVIITGHATNPTAVTISGGTGDQSWMKAAGELALSVPATQVRALGPFDSARFEQSDGNLYINVDQPVTMAVLQLP